jgi:hypothetical protein
MLRGTEPIAPLPPAAQARGGLDWPAPDEAACVALWDRYDMPDHIREHSRLVALVSVTVAEAAARMGAQISVDAVRATALLHDIAKAYTIHHGGNHAQLGGAWALEDTASPAIAMGVFHHVFWPWEPDVRTWLLPLAVLYADKRVRHDELVTLAERYEDLFERYGRNGFIRSRIEISRQQSVAIEREFSQLLGTDLNACTFDSGRLV